MYAGGISYFSSGSVRSGLNGGVCPEAAARVTRKTRQINCCSRLAVSRRLCCVATRLATGRVRPAGGHGGTRHGGQALPWLQLGLTVETVEDLISNYVD